jgi:hypothetical protein
VKLSLLSLLLTCCQRPTLLSLEDKALKLKEPGGAGARGSGYLKTYVPIPLVLHGDD